MIEMTKVSHRPDAQSHGRDICNEQRFNIFIGSGGYNGCGSSAIS